MKRHQRAQGISQAAVMLARCYDKRPIAHEFVPDAGDSSIDPHLARMRISPFVDPERQYGASNHENDIARYTTKRPG
jgi:hypothetical protein